MNEQENPDGYDGEVTVVVDGEQPRTAHAALAARFDPLAGHVVWTGRLATALRPGVPMVVKTPHGTATAQTTEQDPWGNTRLRGSGRPPFPVELLDAAAP